MSQGSVIGLFRCWARAQTHGFGDRPPGPKRLPLENIFKCHSLYRIIMDCWLRKRVRTADQRGAVMFFFSVVGVPIKEKTYSLESFGLLSSSKEPLLAEFSPCWNFSLSPEYTKWKGRKRWKIRPSFKICLCGPITEKTWDFSANKWHHCAWQLEKGSMIKLFENFISWLVSGMEHIEIHLMVFESWQPGYVTGNARPAGQSSQYLGGISRLYNFLESASPAK